MKDIYYISIAAIAKPNHVIDRHHIAVNTLVVPEYLGNDKERNMPAFAYNPPMFTSLEAARKFLSEAKNHKVLKEFLGDIDKLQIAKTKINEDGLFVLKDNEYLADKS